MFLADSIVATNHDGAAEKAKAPDARPLLPAFDECNDQRAPGLFDREFDLVTSGHAIKHCGLLDAKQHRHCWHV